VAFAKQVAEVVAKGGCVIVTIREDYVPRLALHPELQELFRRGDLRATPLSAAELREAIETPAQRINLKFDSGLVDALVSDVVGEPAALPLLQFTLWRLWTKRKRNRLTRDAYREVGGGRSALARAADELYDDLKIVQNQDTMRRILMRMVRPGAHAETTSGRVLVSALMTIGDDPARVQTVLDKLVAARLVRRTCGETAGDDQVEVAHEALIRNWPKLVEWVEQKKSSMTEYRRFEALADEWERFGREYGYLDAEQLKDAEKWLKSDEAKELGVKDSFPALVKESRELLERNRRAERRAKGILVLLIVTIVSVLVWAVITQQKALNAQSQYNASLAAKLAELSKTQSEVTAQKKEKDDIVAQAATALRQLDTRKTTETLPPPVNFVPPVAMVSAPHGTGSACCIVTASDGTSFLLMAGRLFDKEGETVSQTTGVPIGTVALLIGSGATSVALVKLAEGANVPLETIDGVARRPRPGDQVHVKRGSAVTTGRVVVVRDDDIVVTLSAEDGDAGAPVLNARNQLVGIIYAGDKSLSLVIPLAPLLKRENLTLR
jgi:hypothetical protein